MEKVIAVFDIGKTNKKLLLFNKELKIVYLHEEEFPEIADEDGFECDDIDRIDKWIINSLTNLVEKGKYELAGVNFSTYGASLAWLNKEGKRLTPIYNYLKPVSGKFQEELFNLYGGEEEFCRKTASPALGVMLNSGIQIKWIKQSYPEIFEQTAHILHFPQYLSSLLTKQYVSEYTSIGCHTFMWDFDEMTYHKWLDNEKLTLPKPLSNSQTFEIEIAGKKLICGIGIHDSSSSLVPYFKCTNNPFVLVGTGTWCINMNPFNHSPLTLSELRKDCLSYLSVNQKPVKSSRFFMGHIHDTNVERITAYFGVEKNEFRSVKFDRELIKTLLQKGEKGRCFFINGVPEDYIDENVALDQFNNFEEAYHQFMLDLTKEELKSLMLITNSDDEVNTVFLSGGFARNEIFVTLLADFLPGKKLFTSEVDNSSALGAALVIYEKVFTDQLPKIDLGLMKWEGL